MISIMLSQERGEPMRRILAAIAVVLAAGLAFAPGAQAADVLGSRVVKYTSDTDVIPVPGHKRYKEIRFCVEDNSVRFRNVIVTFRNGGKQVIHVDRRINAGTCSPWYALLGWRSDIKRDIRTITLHYDTVP
ncbi:MAG: DUF2541 family protein, partial [Alphaproteobacteria bacterium]